MSQGYLEIYIGWNMGMQRDSIIGGPETAIILWKPNKSLFQGATSVGIHGQKLLFTVSFLDFVTVFNLAYCLCWADSRFLAGKRKWVRP